MADIEKSGEGCDHEINVQEIMSRIRDRIRRHHEHAAAEGFGPNRPLPGGAFATRSGQLEPDLSYDLDQMRLTADSPWLSLAQRERHLPFGSFIFRVENLLHRLILKYVNMLATRQIAFNRAALQVASGLMHIQRDSATRLSALKTDLSQLRERLAILERTRQD